MPKTAHYLVVQVEAPKKLSRKRLCKVLDRLIQIGLEDAGDSDESEDEDLAVVESIEISESQ